MLLLTGDIGGTKTILRLVEATERGKSFRAIAENKYISKDFPDLVPMVREFLSSLSNVNNITAACFAIAGPVIDNTSSLTNLDWELDGNRLQEELKIPQISLINDFAANSYGVLGLKASDIYTLQGGNQRNNAPIAIIGAGTGLGQGFLIPYGDKYQVFPSEGGHSDFAPQTDLEIELLRYLQTQVNSEHISTERLVSGQGIISIYQFFRDAKQEPESSSIRQAIQSWETEPETNIDPAAVISLGATKDNDPLCQKTMSLFIKLYGAETGNLALKLLPYGGIYIAGGIAAKNLSMMQTGEFLAAFKNKGRMQPLLADIPINIVLNPELGVLGSVLYGLRNYSE